MRASKALQNRATARREATDMSRIQAAIEATKPQPAGFAPTSGFSVTERRAQHDWERPGQVVGAIGFQA